MCEDCEALEEESEFYAEEAAKWRRIASRKPASSSESCARLRERCVKWEGIKAKKTPRR